MPSAPAVPAPPSTNSQKRPADMYAATPSKLRVPRSTVTHFNSRIVRIRLEPLGQEFTVYADKLSLSPFINQLMTSNKTETLQLPPLRELGHTEFKIYLHFLYTGTLATDSAGASNTSAALRIETAFIGRLYKLGLVMLDSKFRNATLDGILEISCHKDKSTGVPYLPDPGTFSDLPSNSPAKRCIVDLYVHFLDPEDPAIDRPENQEFMREILKASMRKSDVKSEHGEFRRRDLRRCDYHEHGDGARCDDADEE